MGADDNFLQFLKSMAFFKVALILALLFFLTRYLRVFVINVAYSSILLLAFEVLVLIFFFCLFCDHWYPVNGMFVHLVYSLICLNTINKFYESL